MTSPDAMSAAGTLATFLLGLVVIPIVSGLVLTAPQLVILGFIGVLFVFSDSTWGQLNVESTIYGRGAGLFYFSLINMALLLADAGFSGFLFRIPTLLIGTPIIEFRTMLLLGLTLAMPFVAAGLGQTRPRMINYHNTNNHYAVA